MLKFVVIDDHIESVPLLAKNFLKMKDRRHELDRENYPQISHLKEPLLLDDLA